MANIRVGVFGCGNMGRAIVQSIHSQFPKTDFYLFNPTKAKADQLALLVGGNSLEHVLDMPLDLDWYILGFKPQSLDTFEFNFNSDAKIISLLAGVNTQKISMKFNISKVARLMPNTPSAIGLGANLLFLNSKFNQLETKEINLLLSATGKCFSMESEEDLDLTTAFSGSGPALIFEMARIFEAELTKMTNGRVPAKEIISQTFFGSSSLMNSEMNKSTSFEELRNQVTSKNGVTYEALHILDQNKLHEIFSLAFEAAYKRTIELSK